MGDVSARREKPGDRKRRLNRRRIVLQLLEADGATLTMATPTPGLERMADEEGLGTWSGIVTGSHNTTTGVGHATLGAIAAGAAREAGLAALGEAGNEQPMGAGEASGIVGGVVNTGVNTGVNIADLGESIVNAAVIPERPANWKAMSKTQRRNWYKRKLGYAHSVERGNS